MFSIDWGRMGLIALIIILTFLVLHIEGCAYFIYDTVTSEIQRASK